MSDAEGAGGARGAGSAPGAGGARKAQDEAESAAGARSAGGAPESADAADGAPESGRAKGAGSDGGKGGGATAADGGRPGGLPGKGTRAGRGAGFAKVEEQLGDALYGLGWGTVKRLPESVAVQLGRTIADVTWKKRGKGVRRLESNLARVVPHATPDELSALSKAGMRSYMRYWMESFRLPVWSEERITNGFDPKDVHHLTEGLASDRGVILALPHLGNWDLAGAWVTTALATPFTTVMERLKPETLYDRFVAYRAGLGMEVLPHTGGSAFGTLARRLRAGGLVCLVADRDLSASGMEVSFFGERTRMPAGPAILAQQTGALLLPVTLWYDDSPVMRGRVHPPIDVPASGNRLEKASVMTQALADTFAAGIAEHPEDWHMLQRLWLADLEPEPAAPDGAGESP